MNTRKTVWILASVAALNAAILAPNAVANDRFSLLKAVPEDVFLCTAGRHNAERAFLDEYWSEVFDALKATGIGADVMELLGSAMGEEQITAVEELKARAKQLLDGVDWTALGGGEIVFAERLGAVVKTDNSLYMGPPDMLFLIRGAKGSAAKNYDGLVGILNGIAAEVNKGVGKETFVVEAATKAGVKIATLDFMKMVPQAPPMPLAVSVRGDVIMITLGSQILDEALGLLDGESDKTSLVGTRRFKNAFKGLPAPEDELTFFDMQAMLKSIQPLIDAALTEVASSSGGSDVYAEVPDDPQVKEFHQKAIDAYQADDYEMALKYTKKEYDVLPGNSRAMYNLACFNTLLGNKEEGLSWLEKAVEHGFHAPKQIASDSDLKALHGDKRFEVALANAKEKAGGGKGHWGSQIKHLSQRLMDVPGIVDYVASVVYTDGHSVYSEETTALVPGAEGKPIYPVFGKRKSLTSFDRYLPEETVSFSVDAGFDLVELYQFAEETIRGVGPEGEKILAKWAELQQQNGINLRDEILGLIHGEMISATVRQPMGDASVFMMKVTDEEAARTKLASALEFLVVNMPKMAQQNPMMGMFAPRTSPCTHEKLGGFHNLTFGMQPMPMVCGVKDGYVMFGSSADAVALCLATAAGDHPNITQNKEVMAEAVRPKGAFRSISYTDKRNTGKELAQVVGALSMGGGMAAAFVPDPEAQQMLMKVLGIVGKLSPVLQKLDFYKSASEVCSFDGKAWHSRSVTNYKAPGKDAAGEDI